MRLRALRGADRRGAAASRSAAKLDLRRPRHYNFAMKIVDLTNVTRKETHIYYRREFKADAVFEVMHQSRTVPVEFVLEHKPTGSVEVSAQVVEGLDYPMLPFVAKLKHFISEMDKRGALP